MNIGEEQEEIEVIPTSVPAEEPTPTTAPAEKPVEPVKEPVPA